MHVGANYQNGKCDFIVWAPNHKHLRLLLDGDRERLDMQQTKDGYWHQAVSGIEPEALYMFQIDDNLARPDPASHFQPNGVLGPSAIVDQSEFGWQDSQWRGLDIKDMVFYELHVGAFTPEGTFKGAQHRIKELQELGVNAIELMPIIQFSGNRNWGYDGVFPFAVHNTYGAPNDFKALVNECHFRGVALFIDFVYNHLGPEGNCLNDYAPYFPSTRMGRWGATINLDGEQSGGVRNYFLENTLHWFRDYHIDGIRLDAVLSMQDSSSKHFLTELNQTVDSLCAETGKKSHLIAESGYNVPKVLSPIEQGGYGFDAQWLDDFQHALFAPITGEREGYYRHYGKLEDFIEVLSEGYVYVGGEHDFRRRSPNESYRWIPADKFIVFSQNHDQIGNRLLGDRLTSIAGSEAAKIAAGLTLLSPYVPLLFMGEEYGEIAPFLFFTDYQSKALIDSIREGRRKEFAEFHWQGEIPDPQSLETLEKSKLNWQLRHQEKGRKIASYFHALIQLRRSSPLFGASAGRQISRVSSKDEQLLFILKQQENFSAVLIANFIAKPACFGFPFAEGTYRKVLDSANPAFGGQVQTLPDTAVVDTACSAGGFNFAVYLSEGGKGGVG